ncbi:ADP-ribosylglycohydrolase family protein [Ruminococcus sp. 5_1_39BFAA]|uniref:ADP-ribosylglycohydrolase family protein n=1 Tax=Ruminococcus sp. 5_1_39BFAA TaxID=457412 RepID=UPI003566FE2C
MLGAIAGDIIGQPYEFMQNMKTTDFELLNIERNLFTDDSVMTIAIAKGILEAGINASDEALSEKMKECMISYGRRYPNAGYGSSFHHWIYQENPRPYNSWGNGSAMRVGSVAWLFQNDLCRTLDVARLSRSAELTHNHPEGIKGAVSTAHIIWMALNEYDKSEIRDTVEDKYYKLDRNCDVIRKEYRFDVSCQGTVPVAIECFLEGNNYEEIVRLAVSMGGDSDTLACIAGSMAEAYYGVPYSIKKKVYQILPADLLACLHQFNDYITDKLCIDRTLCKEHDGNASLECKSGSIDIK